MQLESILLPDVDPTRPVVMAGPCSAESERQVLQTARELADRGVRIFRSGIWKPRTKPGGFEGVGTEGLAWLKRVRRETGMYTATEVANRDHVFEALKAGIDMLWIGARTAVNPFAVQEIADALRGTDLPVLVKNPVNPDLELWIGAIQRIYRSGIRRLGAIHRGFSSYGQRVHRNPPLWQIPIELRRRLPDLPILCDPSHIAGRREYLAELSQQAMDLDFDGLVVESHCDPDSALSDREQQITPEDLAGLLDRLVVRDRNKGAEILSGLRDGIDRIDQRILELLGQRMSLSTEIGQYKKQHGMTILQTNRYGEIMKQRCRWGEAVGLTADFVKEILLEIHEESVRRQMLVMNRSE